MIAYFFVIFFDKQDLCLMVLFYALTNSQHHSAFAEQQIWNIVKPSKMYGYHYGNSYFELGTKMIV